MYVTKHVVSVLKACMPNHGAVTPFHTHDKTKRSLTQ